MMEPQRRITKDYFDVVREQYAPLVQRLATIYGFNQTQIEELKSHAQDELLKCAICYQNIGSFMTFLFSRLSGVFSHLRDTEIRASRLKTMSLDAMKNVAAPSCSVDFNITAEECLECLDNDEHYVITELFFNNRTMRDISSDRGVVPSTVCRIKKRAMVKMRKKCKVGLE